jgi:hypothetical protein
MRVVPGGLTDFTCPRCENAVSERFYGPCGTCREQLRAAMSSSGVASDEAAGTTRFEPALHVVPNHVATKD